MSALRANLGGSLDLLADVVRRPAFPAAMVELQRKQQLAEIEQDQASPTDMALRVLPRLVYGPGHAYSGPTGGLGRLESVSKLPREKLQAWHRDWVKPNNATLIVAGDVTMAQLMPALQKSFGDWAGGPVPEKTLAVATSPGRGKIYLIDKPDAPQSVLVAAHLGHAGAGKDDLALETVMRNFGGMATSRLNRNLRLDKHWSYGTQGVIQDARGQRPFLVLAPVQTDKTKESVAEVIKELGDIAGARPIRGEEFASIMRTQTLGLPGRWATLQSLEAAAIQILNYGYPDDYFSTYASRVRGLKESELEAAAKKFIRPSQIVWVIVGDLSQIEKGVRELNLGTVAIVDAS
jgi:zinc protease